MSRHVVSRLFAASLFVAALAGTARGQDVIVQLDQFGVGGSYRPGDIVGVRVKLTVPPESPLEDVTSAWVQWELPNADGDIEGRGRPVTLTKSASGASRAWWLYGRLPYNVTANSVWPVRVYEYEDGQRGRELGGLRLSPPATGRVEMTDAMIGVVGPARMGLQELGLNQSPQMGLVHTAHEDTRHVFGLRPDQFPDERDGLTAFEAIAWSGIDVRPGDLGDAQADALREYVRRGGHLIISLPTDTNPWGIGEIVQVTPLAELLPLAPPRKDESVLLADILPVLSKERVFPKGKVPPLEYTVRVFRDGGDFDAIDNGYQPLMALPDGRVVVIQRTFGHGLITIVGFDLSSADLTRTRELANGVYASLPQADVFWNRILGRRADTPSSGEIQEIDEAERLSRSMPHEHTLGAGDEIRPTINLVGKATAGLMMALVLFLAYWVLAGPGGFALLKRYGRVRHAWVAFAASAGVFTALAWGGVNVIRKNQVYVQHLTVLDHIARAPGDTRGENDPQLQRAVAWMSVYLPGYRPTEVAIESAQATGSVPSQRDGLLSWSPQKDPAPTFPNPDRYVVNVATDPARFEMPARATSTQLHADWLGGVDPTAWGGLLRVDPENPIVEFTQNGQPALRGAILNELPGDLTSVKIIWITGRRSPDRRYGMIGDEEMPWVPVRSAGDILNRGYMHVVPLWQQGAPLLMPSVDPEAMLEPNIDELYVEPYRHGEMMPQRQLATNEQRRHLEMLSFYHQLEPPTYLKLPSTQDGDTLMARRVSGRELDLSPWFNRPCIIVIGYLENSSCPIPLRVDGEPVKSDGLTVIRWIYPLPVKDAAVKPAVAVGGAGTGPASK